MYVVLLSGTSGVGINIIQARRDNNANCKTVCFTSDKDSPACSLFEEIYLIRKIKENPSEVSRFLLDFIKNKNPNLIIPCRDEDVVFLANFKESHPEYSSLILTGASSMASIFYDKYLCYEYCKENEINHAPTIKCSSLSQLINFAENAGYPMIVKPISGFASKGVYLANNEKALRKLNPGPDYIAQKYMVDNIEMLNSFANLAKNEILPLFYSLEEVKLSFQYFISEAGEIIGSFATKNHMLCGESKVVEPLSDAHLLDVARAWAEKIALSGWTGPLNIQAKLDNNYVLSVFEINGRFTGATHASS